MTVLPIIAREFRAESQRPAAWWLRLVCGAALAFALLTVLANANFAGMLTRGRPVSGDQIFPQLHATLLLAILVIVPAMTADCISRERRENTLGLLFLTPLTPAAIVIGKSLVQILRALAMLITALPFLVFCVVLGGVSATDLALSACYNLSALCLALAAGLIATSFCSKLSRALIVSLTLSLALTIAHTWLAKEVWYYLDSLLRVSGWTPGLAQQAAIGLDLGNFWSALIPTSTQTASVFFVVTAIGTAFSIAILYGSIFFAGFCVRRSITTTASSEGPGRIETRLTTPIIGRAFLHRLHRHALERSPIRWLNTHTWHARATQWGWCAAVAGLETILSIAEPRIGLGYQRHLATVLLFGITLSAATSYRAERENGVLELILVSPIREWQIVTARLWELFRQFLPSVLLIAGAWWWLAQVFAYEPSREVFTGLLFLLFAVTAAVAGLYFALLASSFLVAWVATMATALLGPYLFLNLTREFGSAVVVVIMLGLVCTFLYHTRADLIQRRFTLG